MRFRFRTAVTAALVLAVLAMPALASASSWQGPSPLSGAGIDTGRAAQIALGPAGDAAATWYEDTAGGRTMLVRKRAGQAWSAPVSLGASTFNTKLSGVDGAGDVTAAGTAGGDIATVSDWPAGAAAPTTIPLTSTADGTVLVRSMAVSSSGDVVIGMTARGPAPATTFDVLVAYRRGTGGAFSLHRYIPGAGISFGDPSVALNDAGSAIVSFVATSNTTSQALAAVRTATTDWPVSPQPVSPRTNVESFTTAPVGMDSAGNALVAYTYNPALADYRVVVSRYRSFQQDWTESADLSATDAVGPALSVNATGQAILAWSTTHVSSALNIAYDRVGTTADPNGFGPTETVSGPFAGGVSAAIGADGRAVVGWLTTGATGDTDEARIREANGAWSDIRDLSPSTLGSDAPSVATDGHGHVAAVHTQLEGAAHRTMVSSLDSVAPTVGAIALSGSALAGDQLALAVPASDVWSPLAATWTFGDGTTATGLSAAHTYDAAGTYSAAVTVTDGAGNAVARQVAITIGAKQSALTAATFAAAWKQSRVKGTLVVKGSVPRAGTYAITATRGNAVKLRVSLTLPVGAFSKALKLTSRLLPGTYRVALVPPFAANQVTPSARDAKLKAPVEGVVDVVALSGVKNGPAARSVHNVHRIWARFHFAAGTKGALKLTWYRVGKGKPKSLGSATKSASAVVGSYFQPGGVIHGTFRVVLSRKGKSIAQATIKAT